jgi:hypothetical protein
MLIPDLWRHEAGKCFCISTKHGKAWRDKAFHRSELGAVADYVREQGDKNVYFCPHGFKSDRPPSGYKSFRATPNAVMPSVLWLDMDAIDPRNIDLTPTIAIESSPGRYVGLWELDDVMPQRLNERLGEYFGDKQGGWDITQVLRVPGTVNYKYAALPRVRLLWDDGPDYSVTDLDRVLPQLKQRKRKSDTAGVDFAAVAELDGIKLAVKYKAAFSAPPKINAQGRPDRSNTWMWIAGVARKNGASNEEIGAILLRCKRTFRSRYPDGLNDRRAREEIERVCNNLRE